MGLGSLKFVALCCSLQVVHDSPKVGDACPIPRVIQSWSTTTHTGYNFNHYIIVVDGDTVRITAKEKRHVR